jgi:hypothetical protein
MMATPALAGASEEARRARVVIADARKSSTATGRYPMRLAASARAAYAASSPDISARPERYFYEALCQMLEQRIAEIMR